MRETGTGTGPDAGLEEQVFFRLKRTVSDRFEVEDIYVSGNTIRFEFKDIKGDFGSVREEFRMLGYHIYLKRHGEKNICILTPWRVSPKGKRKATIVAYSLFAATLVSTTLAGLGQSAGLVYFGLMNNPWVGAFEFSIPLLLILGAHELAHKWAAVRNGIDSSPPYFIPFPLPSSIIGTMGAVIKIKSPMPDRNAAVALGVSGPLAGFLVAVPVLVAGLYMSPVVPVSRLAGESGLIDLGNSLLIHVVASLIVHVPENYEMFHHPLAVAGWTGLLVTGLNLIPMGQLDGGHVARALLGARRHELLSRALAAVLFGAGALWFAGYYGLLGAAGDFVVLRFWPGWLVWGVLGYLIVRRGYPEPLNDTEPVSAASRVWGIVALVIFILCFIPNPISMRALGQ